MFRKRLKKISISLIATMMILVGLGFTNPVKADEFATINVTKTADKEEFSAIGDIITYNFVVKNTSTDVLHTLSSITLIDDKIGEIPLPTTTLPPEGVVSVTADYEVTQADMVQKEVINEVTAKGTYLGGTHTATATTTATVPLAELPDLVVTGYDGIYDGASHSVVVDLSTIAGGTVEYSTDGGVTYGLQQPSHTDVGEYSVSVRVTKEYYPTRIQLRTVNITPKEATITVDNSEKVYGEADPVFTGTVEGLVAGESLGVGYYRLGTDEDAGHYVGVLRATHLINPNYDVSINNGNFTIRKTGDVTVRYEDTKGNVIEEFTLNGKSGTGWYSSDEEFPGYKFKEVIGDTSGTFTEQAQEVTYVYYTEIPGTPIEPIINGFVKVSYVNEDGEAISPTVTLKGNQETKWSSEKLTMNGYELVEVEGETDGIFEEDTQYVKYIYKVIPLVDGDDGVPFKAGEPGEDGTDGTDGDDGQPGKPGEPGEPVEDGTDGTDGDDRQPGKPGEPKTTEVSEESETPEDDKLPSTGMSNTFTIMNMMMIGAGVVLKSLSKKEED